MTIQDRINKLKKEKDAIILAHYYVEGEVQDIADYVGDSYYLSKIAAEAKQQTIVFCGVSFMGESAKILNPQKTVLMPDEKADCPMAHMASEEKIKELKKQIPDLAVVCYINSTAKLKSFSDVIVTSANVVKIVKALPNKHIYFIPDKNLGNYVSKQIPEKKFIFNDGGCPIHEKVQVEKVKETKAKHPGVKMLAHPECTEEVLAHADYIGSTTGIIDYATNTPDNEYIICTEKGVLHELQKQNPKKRFYMAAPMCCDDMKFITLEKVYQVLKTGTNEVHVDEEIAKKALIPLQRMLDLSK